MKQIGEALFDQWRSAERGYVWKLRGRGPQDARVFSAYCLIKEGTPGTPIGEFCNSDHTDHGICHGLVFRVFNDAPVVVWADGKSTNGELEFLHQVDEINEFSLRGRSDDLVANGKLGTPVFGFLAAEIDRRKVPTQGDAFVECEVGISSVGLSGFVGAGGYSEKYSLAIRFTKS